MKSYVITFAAICLLVSAGCGDNKKGAPAPAPVSPIVDLELETTSILNTKSLISYDFQPPQKQCNTGTRVSLSMQQYCHQLQSQISNNNCADRRRMQIFASDCSGQQWDPELTSKTLKDQPGAHITCYASDPSEDAIEARTLNRDTFDKYENDEHFIDPASAISYGNFIAVVIIDLKDGLFRVKLRAFDKATGRFLIETEKSWKDQMPDEILLESVSEGVRVYCNPSIR